jgi:hypothetical protein
MDGNGIQLLGSQINISQKGTTTIQRTPTYVNVFSLFIPSTGASKETSCRLMPPDLPDPSDHLRWATVAAYEEVGL